MNNTYNCLKLDYEDNIAIVSFNKPEKLNAFTMQFFKELFDVTAKLENNDNIIVVILKGLGKSFSAGLDFLDLFNYFEKNKRAKDEKDFLYNQILFMQNSISTLSNSKKVYIAAIHGYCIGAGLDLAATCDIRLASDDAIFSIMETKLGIVSDLGSLQRLPKIIGESNTRLLALTAANIDAQKALSLNFVSEVYKSHDELFIKAFELAKNIVSNPKEAVLGTKLILNYGLSNNIETSLGYVAQLNVSILDIKNIKDRFLNNIKRLVK